MHYNEDYQAALKDFTQVETIEKKIGQIELLKTDTSQLPIEKDEKSVSSLERIRQDLDKRECDRKVLLRDLTTDGDGGEVENRIVPHHDSEDGL